MDAGSISGFDAYYMGQSLIFADETRENQRLCNAAARDPSDRIKQYIVLLFKIKRIELMQTIQNSRGVACYVLEVIITDRSKGDSGGDAAISNFQIKRAFEDLKELHHLVEH